MMNEDIMRKAGFGKQVDDVKIGKCPFCSKVVKKEDFTDELSLKEYYISGMCQKCMDEYF